MKKLFLFPLLILLIIGFILTGCSGTSTPTTSAPTTAAPTTSAPTTAATTTSAPTTTLAPTTSAAPTGPVAKKTLTIGLITDLTGTLGNQNMNLFNLYAEMDNAKGGVKIGNDVYNIKFITYSNDNDINKSASAMNRLVHQDKLKFIISHGGQSDVVLPISEPAHVLCFSQCGIWNTGFLDKQKLSFALLGQGTHEISVAGYLAETYPEMKGPNGLAMALPDNAVGHITAAYISYPYKAMGCQPNIVYFPSDQRDLSSLGTKIAFTNPAWYFPNIGKVEDMALASSAAYDAGYRGHYFSFLTSDVGLLAPIFKPEVLEGFINACSAMETNPAMSQLAADIKQAWVAKYGQWDYPDYMTGPCYFALIEALKKAGSTDVDAVAKVLHDGMKGLDVPDGKLDMITRPDMRLDGLYVDGVMDNSLKQIKSKQPVVIAHFGPEKSLEYVRKGYPPLPPGQTPTIVPPM
jgi:ABC-type branched-subunit amino acid transport system substrate-binding protein